MKNKNEQAVIHTENSSIEKTQHGIIELINLEGNV